MTPATTFEHIYVHVPFCRRRCSYCDFSIAVRRTVPALAFIDAIMAEVATRRIRIDGARLRSLYLGGGTPSQLGGEGIRTLLDGFRRLADVDEFSTDGAPTEVTIEVNPEDVTPEAAATWVAAGVDRVSLGAQSFHDPVLRWMHRGHSAEGIGTAVRDLRAAGIQNLSLDLIFAVPSALGRTWRTDLDRALELEPEHLSLYGLTVEPHTPLGRWTARGEAIEAPEDRYAEEFLEAHERLSASGYEHYEVSNYGKPGRQSRHNRSYWTGVPYLGLGPSAHGFDGDERRWNVPALAAWETAVGAGRDPLAGAETLDEEARRAEAVYLGLRTTDGLAISQNELKTVSPWIQEGWGRLENGRLVLTALGWLRLDAIAASLTSLRSHS
jgi:oxygen-independent coproporphyrinogen III oxidase